MYSIHILRRAQKELASIPTNSYQKLKAALVNLAVTPRPQGCAKLVGRPGWRLRVGDFRIVYEIDDAAQTVIVLHVGNRRDVYRSF